MKQLGLSSFLEGPAATGILQGMIIKHIIRDLLRFWHCIDNAIAQPGIISEVISGRVDITVTLADQATFDSLLKGTSQSEFLQAYLTGDISVDGDMDALIQLQKLLPIPNMQSS